MSWKDGERLTGLYRCMTVAKVLQITALADESVSLITKSINTLAAAGSSSAVDQ